MRVTLLHILLLRSKQRDSTLNDNYSGSILECDSRTHQILTSEEEWIPPIHYLNYYVTAEEVMSYDGIVKDVTS